MDWGFHIAKTPPSLSELHSECLCRCLGCRFWRPGPAIFGSLEHPIQVHQRAGRCTSRSPLYPHSTARGMPRRTARHGWARSAGARSQDRGVGRPSRRQGRVGRVFEPDVPLHRTASAEISFWTRCPCFVRERCCSWCSTRDSSSSRVRPIPVPPVDSLTVCIVVVTVYRAGKWTRHW